jgi:hypothetical protein
MLRLAVCSLLLLIPSRGTFQQTLQPSDEAATLEDGPSPGSAVRLGALQSGLALRTASLDEELQHTKLPESGGSASRALALVDVSSHVSTEASTRLWAMAAGTASSGDAAGMGLGPDMFINPVVAGVLGPAIMEFIQKMGNYAGSIVPARINLFMVAQFGGPTPLSIYYMIIDILDMIIGMLQMAFGMAAQIKMLAYNTARNAILQANLAKAQANAMLIAAKNQANAQLLQARMQAIAVATVARNQMLAAKAALKAAALAARSQTLAAMKAAKAALAAAAAQAQAAQAMAKAMGDNLPSVPKPPMPKLPSGPPSLPSGPPDLPSPADAAKKAAMSDVLNRTAAATAAAGAAAAVEAGQKAARASQKLQALAEATKRASAAAAAVVAASQSPGVPVTTRNHMATVAARAAAVQERAQKQADMVTQAAEALAQAADDNARVAIRAAATTGVVPTPAKPPPPPPKEDGMAAVARAAAYAEQSVAQAPHAWTPEVEATGAPNWYKAMRGATDPRFSVTDKEVEEEQDDVDAVSLLEELSQLHEAHHAAHRGEAHPVSRSRRPVLVDVALALRSATRQVMHAAAGLEEELRLVAEEGLTSTMEQATLHSLRAAAVLSQVLPAEPGVELIDLASAVRDYQGPMEDPRPHQPLHSSETQASLDLLTKGPSFAELSAEVRASIRSAHSFRTRLEAWERAVDDPSLLLQEGAISQAAVRAAVRSANEATLQVAAEIRAQELHTAVERARLLSKGMSLQGKVPPTMDDVIEHKAGPDWEVMGTAEQELTKTHEPKTAELASALITSMLTQDVLSDALSVVAPLVQEQAIDDAASQTVRGASLALTAGIGYATSTALVSSGTAAVFRDTADLATRALATQIAGAVTASVTDTLREVRGGTPGNVEHGASSMPQTGGVQSGNQPPGARGMSRFSALPSKECQLCTQAPGAGGFAGLEGYLALDETDANKRKPFEEAALKVLQQCDRCSASLVARFANSTAEHLAYAWVREEMVPPPLREKWLTKNGEEKK